MGTRGKKVVEVLHQVGHCPSSNRHSLADERSDPSQVVGEVNGAPVHMCVHPRLPAWLGHRGLPLAPIRPQAADVK